jgi:hypothetical protein
MRGEKNAMNIVTHEFSFAVDQPETVLKPLLALLQSDTQRNRAATPRSAYLLDAQSVLIIDADRMRATALVQALHRAGYRSLPVETELEAFTLFLKGIYIPQAVLLGHEHHISQLFLQRLLQQSAQKYGRKVPVIRLHATESTLATPPITASPRILSQPLLPSPVQEPGIQMSGIEQLEREKMTLEGLDIGRYHLEALLGGGLQGNVYRTYDRLREHEIALKAVHVNSLPYAIARVSEEEANLFQQEIDLLSTLDHPHIQVPLKAGRSYVSSLHGTRALAQPDFARIGPIRAGGYRLRTTDRATTISGSLRICSEIPPHEYAASTTQRIQCRAHACSRPRSAARTGEEAR